MLIEVDLKLADYMLLCGDYLNSGPD